MSLYIILWFLKKVGVFGYSLARKSNHTAKTPKGPKHLGFKFLGFKKQLGRRPGWWSDLPEAERSGADHLGAVAGGSLGHLSLTC